VRIRAAEPGDARRIAEIHVRSWRAAYRGILPDSVLDELSVEERERSWEALLSGGGDAWLTLVAEEEAVLAGFCSVATPGGEAAEIGALYVDPDRWRRGVGSALMSATLAALSERGRHDAVLWVLPENQPALAFYERFGFAVEHGIEKVEERSGRPVIRLRLDPAYKEN
jgi:ribosomal protein S18 acetylase RimI-like enzyme